MTEYMLLVVAQCLIMLYALYSYINAKYSYWRKQGIDGPEPHLWHFGNVVQIEGSDPSKVELELLAKYGKIYGNYTGLRPTLTIIDHELIKQVLVKDFPLFLNRRALNSFHDYINVNQFFTESEHWKKVRTLTGPTFTTGKLKSMYPMMDQAVDKLVRYLESATTQRNGVIETRDVVVGFAIDVIASTTFATEINANQEGDGNNQRSSNPLIAHGMAFFDINPLRAASYLAMPSWFNRLVKVNHIFNVKAFDFFAGLIRQIVQQRRLTADSNGKAKMSSKKTDFVQLLMDAKVDESDLQNSGYDRLAASIEADENNNQVEPDSSMPLLANSKSSKKATLTENEIIAQGIVFFVAGFETTASTIATCLFELAWNPDIQERLHQELKDALKQDADDNTSSDTNAPGYYEKVMSQIPYLDAVMKESLRKYPPIKRLERRLEVDEYRLGEGKILLRKHQLVEIPIYAVHHCPDYFPEPSRFNPDRFMPENKHLLVEYTYLAFGSGPRNCIGMRFAYQEIKLCLAKVVQRFRLSPAPDTPRQLTFIPFKMTLDSVPFPLKVERRL